MEFGAAVRLFLDIGQVQSYFLFDSYQKAKMRIFYQPMDVS